MNGRFEADVVAVIAPIGADAVNIDVVLRRGGLAPRICRTAAGFRQVMAGQCGAIVMTEEALAAELDSALAQTFEAQPPLSDIPVVLISSVGPRNMGPA